MFTLYLKCYGVSFRNLETWQLFIKRNAIIKMLNAFNYFAIFNNYFKVSGNVHRIYVSFMKILDLKTGVSTLSKYFNKYLKS